MEKNSRPYKHNVLNDMHWLVRDAIPGDVLVFFCTCIKYLFLAGLLTEIFVSLGTRDTSRRQKR